VSGSSLLLPRYGRRLFFHEREKVLVDEALGFIFTQAIADTKKSHAR